MTQPAKSQRVVALPQVCNVAFYQGDDFYLDVTVTDPDGTTPVDVSDVNPRAQIRLTAEAEEVLAEFDIDPDDIGVLHLHLPAADSATLPLLVVWDLQIETPDVVTIMAGTLRVNRQVTR